MSRQYHNLNRLYNALQRTGSDMEIETWSFDRAISDVFRLLSLELCPRPTEEHAPAKPLSGM